MEMPEPSFRISTPKIFMQVAAPFSLVPASVMSKGSTWSEYQGLGFGLEAGDGVEALAAELVDGGIGRQAVGADQRLVEDRVLRQEDVVVGLELGTDVVHVGDEGAAQLMHQGEQGMTVEVDPDEGAGERK